MWLWVLLAIFAVIVYWYCTAPSNLPRGPKGLPFVGSLPFLSPHLHRSFAELGKKYGSVFHLYMGSRLIIVLNDYKAAKEAFVKQADVFAGRPHDVFFKEAPEDNFGLTATDNEFWKQHRRFILTNLRDSGVGKLSLEPLLMNEIKHFINEVKKSEGKELNIRPLFMFSISNIIHLLLNGNRYDYDHPLHKNVEKIFDGFLEFAGAASLQMCFPWLLKVPGNEIILRRKQIRSIIQSFVNIMHEIVEETKAKIAAGSRSSGGYISDYLNEKETRSRTIANDDVFTDEGLVHNSRDLLAGTETSSSTLLWLILYLTNYPEVQKKVQKEVDEIVGHEREPSYNDRVHMPYTEATLCEIHRIISLVPLSIPHRNTKETTLFGHTIPQDTSIFINLWNIHHNQELWGDPENFRPERFLNNENKLTKPEYFVPFSLGKRFCVGEPLARMELFLYFVSMIQHFEFVPPNGKMPTLEPKAGFLIQPVASVVCAKFRVF